jgi:hypothetical protein
MTAVAPGRKRRRGGNMDRKKVFSFFALINFKFYTVHLYCKSQHSDQQNALYCSSDFYIIILNIPILNC